MGHRKNCGRQRLSVSLADGERNIHDLGWSNRSPMSESKTGMLLNNFPGEGMHVGCSATLYKGRVLPQHTFHAAGCTPHSNRRGRRRRVKCPKNFARLRRAHLYHFAPGRTQVFCFFTFVVYLPAVHLREGVEDVEM